MRVKGLKSEYGGQKSEIGGLASEVREDWRRRSEIRSLRSDINFGLRIWKQGGRGLVSEVGDQKAETRSKRQLAEERNKK